MAKTQTDEAVTTAEPTMAQVLERMVDIQAATLALQTSGLGVQQAQLKQTAPKSNANGPLIGPFNLRGDKDYPLPLLKCDFYAPWKMTPTYHSLDREEVELVNLLEPGDYPVDMVDGSTVRVSVVGVRNHATGALEQMALMGAKDDQGVHGGLFTNERRHEFPAMRVMLRQMVGEPADAVMTMKKEAELIRTGMLSVSLGE
jgi:hypothetical protein